MNTNKILGLFDMYRVTIVKVNDVEKDELVTFAGPSDESDNAVLYLEYGDEYNIKFSKGGLDGAIINDNGNLVMEDTDGDSIEFEYQEIKSIHLADFDLY